MACFASNTHLRYSMNKRIALCERRKSVWKRLYFNFCIEEDKDDARLDTL
jgi:hypothetical protein